MCCNLPGREFESNDENHLLVCLGEQGRGGAYQRGVAKEAPVKEGVFW